MKVRFDHHLGSHGVEALEDDKGQSVFDVKDASTDCTDLLISLLESSRRPIIQADDSIQILIVDDRTER